MSRRTRKRRTPPSPVVSSSDSEDSESSRTSSSSSDNDSVETDDVDAHTNLANHILQLFSGMISSEDDDDSDPNWEPVRGVQLPNHKHRRRSKRLMVVVPRGTKRPKSQPKDTPVARSPKEGPPFVPTNLNELVDLSKMCHTNGQTAIYRDCVPLGKMYSSLQKLQSLVGLTLIKQQVFEFILTRLQDDPKVSCLNHMILAGPPGCGKTTLCHILGDILCHLGICDTPNVVFGTQGNMIAGFLGQTATKTEEIIRSAFGGVLVIDEASSLADGRSAENGDSFSKSCLDTLNRMLSEHGDKFVCILSGYKKEIYRDILAINPGLRRRFSIHFEVEPYSAADLRHIFQHKILTCPQVTAPVGTVPDVEWFKERKRYFPHYGGDCELLLAKSLTMSALRTFGGTKAEKHTITRSDIDKGFERLKIQYADRNIDTEYETMRLFYT